jgi:macrolide transport system ATP-binding/permease protein
MPFLSEAGLNAHTIAFVGTVAFLIALLLAAAPVARLTFQKVPDGLLAGGRGYAGRFWKTMGANMVIVELGVAMVLLAGAGLLGQSLYRLMHVSLGFDSGQLATIAVTAPNSVYKTDSQLIGLYREISIRISGIPGVKSVGATSMLPVQCDCSTDMIRLEGQPYHEGDDEVDERHIGPDYLRTLKASLIRGRFFTESDDSSHPNVAVINQTLARRYFPSQDPVGQKIVDEEGGHTTSWQIVGVVDDIREGALDATVSPTEYFPINQARQGSFKLVVRTSEDPSVLLPSLVAALRSIDPDLGLNDEATMDQKISGTQAALLHRFTAWIVGGFSAIALLLSVVGLYGVITYSVSQRTREIGLRMALGAQRSAVYRLIMGEAGWLTGAGLAIGLVCSVITSMLIRKLLFGVAVWDLLSLSGACALLGLASLAASYLPARRAASVNPTEALRFE